MTIDLPYRPCVGVVLATPEGFVFTGERVDTPDAWQMPQGGIDPGEDGQTAALRELLEETGVAPSLVTLEAEHPDLIRYELPEHLIGKLWKGRFRGQEQRWYLLRFHGADDDVNIDQKHREFARWRWSTPQEVVRDIVPFKRDVYEQVMAGFADRLASK